MISGILSFVINLLKRCFGGQRLYVKWLNSSTNELGLAQRSRSRAPSWLRDRPARWRQIIKETEEESTLSAMSLVNQSVALPKETSSTVVIEQLNHEERSYTAALTSISPVLPLPQPDQKGGMQTELYLGPIGDDRPNLPSDQAQRRDIDVPLILIVSCLMTIGFIMVYSSSIVRAGLPKGGLAGNPEYFFQQQGYFMAFGIALMYIVSRIPYQLWGLLSACMFIVGCFGLALVFSPIGKTVNGAHRWIHLGINIQPIEFVKFAWITLLCLWFGDRQQDMKSKSVLIIPLMMMLPIVIMLAFQPDFGSMIIISVIFGATYLIAGGGLKILLSAAFILGIPASLFMIARFDHIGDRLSNFLLIFNDPNNLEYNLKQALVSFCSGRFTGVGLGQSSLKEYFLPEAHTDFILAIYGAEFGFLGVVLLVALYVGLLFRCLHIARLAPDLFGSLFVTVSALMLSLQAFINMAMAIGMLPTKGLTLPLISYGGSSLLITCFTLGVIMNVSRSQGIKRDRLRLISWATYLHPFPKLFEYFQANPARLPASFKRRSIGGRRGSL